MQPYYFITGLIARIINVLQKSVNAIGAFLYYLRTQMDKMFGIVIGRIVNVMVPLRIILTKLKDISLQKTIGVAVTLDYILFMVLSRIKAFIGSFLMICIIALIVLVALIIILWIMPWTWPVAAATTVFFLLVSIPIAIIAGLDDSYFKYK